MPRDQRLYMTFPIDFWKHEKVRRLSDAAFRAFVEANGHSRERETDGVIESADAEFIWDASALQELCKSHPTRPLLYRDGDVYVIRDYAEHQFTKADRDELSEKRRKAAEKRWSNASAEQVQSKPVQADAGIGKGIGIKEVPKGTSKRKPEIPLPDKWEPSEKHRTYAVENRLDLDHEVGQFRAHAAANDRRQRDWDSAFRTWLGNAAKWSGGKAAPTRKVPSNDEWMYR